MKTKKVSRYLYFWAVTLLISGGFIVSSNASAGVIHVPRDEATIQDAVDVCEPGDIIQVARGVYPENVVITKSDLRLKGRHAVIDGAGTVSGGVGFGIHVLSDTEEPVSNVEIMGFVVEGFERGIVLENVINSKVHKNEVRNNTDKDPEDGCFNMSDGIVLNAAHFNIVSRNDVHDNGHNGIFLINGCSGNVLRANRSNDNGDQTFCAVPAGAGCGIQLSNGNNNTNRIVANETRRNSWGILLGPSGGSTGNFIGQNRSHENPRAGIATLNEANGNFIQQNNARGNGLGNIPPSGEFDLFNGSTGDNTWLRNKGNANF